jgi:hypothetical protein
MHWITREQVRVGRMGCAWLIKTFIDPDAAFSFASGNELAAEAARLGATAFHVPGSASGRQGDRSSFEVLLDQHHLADDPALVLLSKIVGTADVANSPWNQPEGPGLKAATEGILALCPDDATRIQAGMALYDAFYAYCGSAVAHGKLDGNFK